MEPNLNRFSVPAFPDAKYEKKEHKHYHVTFFANQDEVIFRALFPNAVLYNSVFGPGISVALLPAKQKFTAFNKKLEEAKKNNPQLRVRVYSFHINLRGQIFTQHHLFMNSNNPHDQQILANELPGQQPAGDPDEQPDDQADGSDDEHPDDQADGFDDEHPDDPPGGQPDDQAGGPGHGQHDEQPGDPPGGQQFGGVPGGQQFGGVPGSQQFGGVPGGQQFGGVLGSQQFGGVLGHGQHNDRPESGQHGLVGQGNIKTPSISLDNDSSGRKSSIDLLNIGFMNSANISSVSNGSQQNQAQYFYEHIFGPMNNNS